MEEKGIEKDNEGKRGQAQKKLGEERISDGGGKGSKKESTKVDEKIGQRNNIHGKYGALGNGVEERDSKGSRR